MSKIYLAKLSKDQSVLAGSGAGKRMAASLWDVAKASEPGLFAISFADVSVATSSFMREGIVGFRNQIRADRPDLYPVVCDLNSDVKEELLGLLDQMGEAIWEFEFKDKAVSAQHLLGRIDPKLKETLDLIEKGIGHDAATLWKSTNSTESIGVTAWNNRLASLAKQGLVFESRVGKQKYFHPLNEFRG